MPAPLNLQRPRTLLGGLQSVAEDLNAQMPASEWRTGVQYTSKCDTDSFVWGCEGGATTDPETFDTQKTETDPAAPHDTDFYPGMIGATDQCFVAGRQTVIGDLITQTATMSLDRVRYSQLAEIMYYGTVGRTDQNPSLFTDGQLAAGTDPGNPDSPTTELQRLLAAACSCWDQRLVFHVPVAFMPHLLEESLVEWDGSNYRMGAHLVSFDCYVNLGPEAAGEAAGAGADEFWMYATNTPLIGLDSVDVASSLLDPRKNLFRVVAEQGAIVLFDPCCVYAAKASTLAIS